MVACLALAPAVAASETISYSYDALGRLAAVSSSGKVNNGQSVATINNAAIESAEAMSVTLSAPSSGAIVGAATDTGTINDNDVVTRGPRGTGHDALNATRAARRPARLHERSSIFSFVRSIRDIKMGKRTHQTLYFAVLRRTGSRSRDLRAATMSTAAILALAASPALAQDSAPTDDRTLAEVLSTSVCLSNAIRGGKDGGTPYIIAIPSAEAGAFLERGFTRTDCPEAGLKVITKEARRGVCDLARARNPGINLSFWLRYSFTPEESCKLIGATRSEAVDAT